MKNSEKNYVGAFLSVAKGSILVFVGKFLLFAGVGLVSNVVLGLVEFAYRGFDWRILAIFFLLPAVVYVLGGIRWARMGVARYLWKRAFSQLIKEQIAVSVAEFLMENARMNPQEKLTGEALVGKATERILAIKQMPKHKLAEQTVRFLVRRFLEQYALPAEAAQVITSDIIQNEIVRRFENIYEERLVQFKTGNIIADFFTGQWVNVGIAANIILILWYWFGR